MTTPSPTSLSSLMATISQDPDVMNGLADAGISLPDVSTGVVAGFGQLLSGGGASLSQIAPLVGGALALVGGPVGAVAGTFIAGALGAMNTLESFFGQAQPNHLWTVGGQGFPGPRPFGPADPLWVRWETIVKSVIPKASAPLPADAPFGTPDSTACAGAMGGPPVIAWQWLPTILRDKAQAQAIVASKNPAPRDLLTARFTLLYIAAWERNAELWWNGYQGAGDYQVLVTVASAWNASQAAATAGAAYVPTNTVEPQNDGALTGDFVYTAKWGAAFMPWTCPAAHSYIANLEAGNVDGQDNPAVTILLAPPVAVRTSVLSAAPSPALSLLLAGQAKSSQSLGSAATQAKGAAQIASWIASEATPPSLWQRLVSLF